MSNQPAILLLEDGTEFHGQAAGKVGTTVGEICFNTGMTGYQEIFTDPSYFGQLLIMTSVHIGNYGTFNEDQESKGVQIAGLICKNFTDQYSRPMANAGIQQYCEDEGLVGISGVDTRALVRYVREKGAMNAIISSQSLDKAELMDRLKKAPDMKGLELASRVTTSEPFDYGPEDAKVKVAFMDFGSKKNIMRCLAERGVGMRVFPAKTSFTEIASYEADGYFLSNGPGDPAAMDYAIENVKKMLATGKPLFGICMGHQLLSLALGIPTYKMHIGHRGANHPVKNMITGTCEITSQNHGFGVSREVVEGMSEDVQITHINLNDDTVAGIKLLKQPGFSVQYHPEASPGPHDSRYLFDEFVELLESHKA